MKSARYHYQTQKCARQSQIRDAVCLLCGSGEYQTCFQDSDYRIVCCSVCGFAWKQSAGREDLRPGGGLPLMTGSFSAAVINPAMLTPEVGVSEFEEIHLFNLPPGELLNVGPDQGDIVETARTYGWRPTTLSALEKCPLKRELILSCGRPKSEKIGRGYDVVRLEGALEFSANPSSCLREVAEILCARGLVVISAVNFGDWNFPLWGEGAALFPRTLPHWFFTPHSLEKLLVECGFEVLKISLFRVPRSLNEFAPVMDTLPPGNGRRLPASAPEQTALSIPHFRLLARPREQRKSQALHGRHYQSVPSAPLQDPVPALAAL